MKLYLKPIITLFTLFVTIVFLISCIEDSFPTDIDDLHLTLRDTATVDIEFIPYQTPPEIGSNRYLYMGSNGDFTISHTLIKLGSLIALQDSAFKIVDSRIEFTLVDTVLETEPTFDLYYFAMDSTIDSTIEFSESGTNFTNDDWLSEITFEGPLTSSISQDTSGIYTVKFSVDTSIVMAWADTAAEEQLLVLEAPDLNSEVIQFYSTENSSHEPALIVSYEDSVTVTIDSVDTLVLDTLELVIEMSADVSIVEPPLFSDGTFDSTLIYFSNGAGMKALMNVDLDSLNVPREAVILRAKLILHSDSTNSHWEEDGTFKMKIAALEDTVFNGGDYVWPAFITEDSLGTGILKVSSLDSSFQITHRIDRLVEPIFLEAEENLGFKLETSSTPSIFNIVVFHTSNSLDSTLHPRLEIFYGVP